MSSARTLEEVLASIEEQSLADDELRFSTRPTPWFSLLRYPSGAAWRSSDKVLGGSISPDFDADVGVDADADADVDADEEEERRTRGRATSRKASVLSQTQFNLLRRSDRTNKQLRRTYRRILEVQKALSMKRERERRLAANSVPDGASTSSSLSSSTSLSDDDNDKRQRMKRQSIEDERGRNVGDWRERTVSDRVDSLNRKMTQSTSPPPRHCEDPSVALSLSIGLYSSTAAGAKEKKRRLNEMNNDGCSHKGSDEGEDKHGEISGRNDRGGGLGATDYYYMENEARGASIKSAKVAYRLAKSGLGLAPSDASRKPVAYGPEHAMTNLKFRFGPNYSIVRRVLSEVQSLLGGRGGGEDELRRRAFRPRRVLDFGSGVGSSGAAALDVFGVGRSSNDDGVDWIHSVDASLCMRETTEKVLMSILEGSPWEDEECTRNYAQRLEEEEALLLAEYERSLFGGSTNRERKSLERRRRRMERWEQSWGKRTDARTRLTFGESIVGSSSTVSSSSQPIMNGDRDTYGSDSDTEDHKNCRRLPWQEQLDEQRRRATEKKHRQQQKNKGSFDLILCSYTLSELPSVPASLSAATLLWEKLAPNGVLVFVEPGTPDGFGTLRSVRSMLLECCPPPEVQARRKRHASMVVESLTEKEGSNTDEAELSCDGNDDGDDVWPEECHVIAPCTHNGTCPMSRHQTNHVKRNSRFAKYESAEPKEVSGDERRENTRIDGEDNEDEEEGSFQELLDEWDDMTEGQKDELKKMLSGGEDMSDEEAKTMLEYMDSIDSDDEEGDEDDSESDLDSESDDDVDVGNDQEYYNVKEGTSHNVSSSKKPSTMAKTDVFGSSFCSFVHNFPGGTTRKKGEKFTYLVVQKRVPDFMANERDRGNVMAAPARHHVSLDDIDIVEILSRSVHHAQQLKKEQLQERLRQRHDDGDGRQEVSPEYLYHKHELQDLLQRAVKVEDDFLESTVDSLGLELLHSDERRRGWGRLIRAPLKKKGHVLVDYCSVGCGGGSKGCPRNGTEVGDDDSSSSSNDDLDFLDGTQGRITRQKISRGWSARAAPGCFRAARKARWGGLWPDLSERVKRIEGEDKEGKTKISEPSI